MGRRSQHTPEELRELILGATRRIVEQNGYRALSAREIAREIGYAAGTLYNMFQNLDEILLRVEAIILDEFDAEIGKAMNGKKGAEAIRAFALSCVDFAFEKPRLWELIQYHFPELAKGPPDWYLDSLYAPVSRLEPLVQKHFAMTDPDEISRTARQLWSSIHGIVHVATTQKFGALPRPTVVPMVEELLAELLLKKDRAPNRRKADPVPATKSRRDRHPD